MHSNIAIFLGSRVSGNSGLGFFSGFSGFLDTQVCKTLSLEIIGIVHLDELEKHAFKINTCYNSVYLH